MQIYWNKRKRFHKKRVQLPQDWFGTPTWRPFHCFGTPIWPPWRHVKTLYNVIFCRLESCLVRSLQAHSLRQQYNYFIFSHWQYSHWISLLTIHAIYGGISLGKLAQRQKSKCYKPNFWPVCTLVGLSWHFKVLQWINLNERFRHYCMHREDYLMRFKKNSVEPFYREMGKSAKSQNLKESCTTGSPDVVFVTEWIY